MSKWYVSTCPDTSRVFICQEGVDNNLAEVFARNNSETVGDNAQFLAKALNERDDAIATLEHMESFMRSMQ